MLEAFAAALAPLGEPPALASDGHFAAEAEHNEHNEHNEYDEYDNVDLPPFPVEHYQFRSVWEAILAHL
ncbi:MAG: hypothetical protein ABSB49_15285 [Polyangia bacterium]